MQLKHHVRRRGGWYTLPALTDEGCWCVDNICGDTGALNRGRNPRRHFLPTQGRSRLVRRRGTFWQEDERRCRPGSGTETWDDGCVRYSALETAKCSAARVSSQPCQTLTFIYFFRLTEELWVLLWCRTECENKGHGGHFWPRKVNHKLQPKCLTI